MSQKKKTRHGTSIVTVKSQPVHDFVSTLRQSCTVRMFYRSLNNVIKRRYVSRAVELHKRTRATVTHSACLFIRTHCISTKARHLFVKVNFSHFFHRIAMKGPRKSTDYLMIKRWIKHFLLTLQPLNCQR